MNISCDSPFAGFEAVLILIDGSAKWTMKESCGQLDENQWHFRRKLEEPTTGTLYICPKLEQNNFILKI